MAEIQKINIDPLIQQVINTKVSKHQMYGVLMQKISQLCSIPQDSYAVLGSYPMREYKKIGDLDVDMRQNEWTKLERLQSKYLKIKEHPKSKEKIWELQMSGLYCFINNIQEEFKIQIYACDPSIGYFAEEYKLDNILGNKEKYIQIDQYGNHHYSLETTLRFKQMNNREKDQNDIKILKKVLGVE